MKKTTTRRKHRPEESERTTTSRETVCANCRAPKEEWTENSGRGVEREGKFYCSQACAESEAKAEI